MGWKEFIQETISPVATTNEVFHNALVHHAFVFLLCKGSDNLHASCNC